MTLGSKSSVWYNCVVRGKRSLETLEHSARVRDQRQDPQCCCLVAGDVQPVSIGSGSNLQDGVYAGTVLGSGHKTVVGNNVSVGHGATLRGCTVEDNCLIGMDSVLQEGSHVSPRLSIMLLIISPDVAQAAW